MISLSQSSNDFIASISFFLVHFVIILFKRFKLISSCHHKAFQAHFIRRFKFISSWYLMSLKQTHYWFELCLWERQQFIKAYDISNRSTSYRAQSYDQNKLSFDSIASQMTALQVKNRKSKFFALTQVKIDGETRVINTEERIINLDSNLIDKSKSKLTWKEQIINQLQNSTEDCVLTQKSKSNSFVLEDCTENNVVSEKYNVSYQITICFIFSWCAKQ